MIQTTSHSTQSRNSGVSDNGNPALHAMLPTFWENLAPRERGLLDLVDDMLLRLQSIRLRLTWQSGTISEFSVAGGPSRSFEFNLRNSIFRAVMARLAFLCQELGGQDVSPYGGTGSFTDPRWPHVRFHVDFMNTPAEQRLELTPVFASEPS